MLAKNADTIRNKKEQKKLLRRLQPIGPKARFP